MRRLLLYCILLCLSLPASGQWLMRIDTTVIMRSQGNILPNALAGGLNSPQFSEMDLNGDGVQDLVVYDRIAARLFCYLATAEGYRYAPEYQYRFPADLEGFVLLRDIDCDGDQDLFTHTIFGFKVYEQTAPGSWALLADPLRSEGSSGQINIQINEADYPAIEDIDGDGDLDILIYNFVTGENIRFYRNRSADAGGCGLDFVTEDFFWGRFRECDCGLFAFDEETCADVAGRVQHAGGKTLFVYDQDDDGDVEVVIGQEQCDSLSYLENEGDPDSARFLSHSNAWPSAGRPASIVFPAAFAADINQDGRQDILVSTNADFNLRGAIDFSASIGAWEGQADGSFRFRESDFLQNTMVDIGEGAIPLIAERESDGRQVLYLFRAGIPQEGASDAGIYQLGNLGTAGLPDFDAEGSFDIPGISQLYAQQARLSDGAGPDYVVSFRESGQQRLAWTRYQSGGPVFYTAQSEVLDVPVATGDYVWPVDVGGDGLSDLLIAKSTGRLEFYRNNGSPGAPFFELFDNTFLDISDNVFARDRTVWTGDIDRDGTEDLMTAASDGNILLYRDLRSNLGVVSTPDTLHLLIDGQARPARLGSKVYGAIYDRGSSTDLVLGTSTGGIHWLNDADAAFPGPGNSLLFTAFPNPSAGSLRLRASAGVQVKVYNTQGRLLRSFALPQAEEQQVLDLGTLPNGLYLLRASHPSLGSKTLRIVLNR